MTVMKVNLIYEKEISCKNTHFRLFTDYKSYDVGTHITPWLKFCMQIRVGILNDRQ